MKYGYPKGVMLLITGLILQMWGMGKMGFFIRIEKRRIRMKKEMKGILFFLFILILLAPAGLSEANFEGTVGTRFTITDAGFGTKKPQVYVEYEKEPGVVKKVYAKVEEWSDTAVTCLWKKSLPPGSYNLWGDLQTILQSDPVSQ